MFKNIFTKKNEKNEKNESIPKSNSSPKHTIFLIVGRSGSGKDSIVDSFCEKHPEYKDTKLLSYTTRPKRSESENTHTFITNSEYEHIKNSSEDSIFAETSINDYVYFATQNQLKKCNFYTIDPNGINYINTKIDKDELFRKFLDEENIQFVIIHIYTSEVIRYKRAIARGDDSEVFWSRTNSEDKQFKQFELCPGEHSYNSGKFTPKYFSGTYTVKNNESGDDAFNNVVRKFESIVNFHNH